MFEIRSRQRQGAFATRRRHKPASQPAEPAIITGKYKSKTDIIAAIITVISTAVSSSPSPHVIGAREVPAAPSVSAPSANMSTEFLLDVRGPSCPKVDVIG
ncbi:hypothetical protein Dda_1820 [Drechslerella dactyloides]|uniref:Uncharacterized protein n=1 Tax=Drechslerella dactyloides TaxID=74499 RepID=A0AAD6NLS3_DREDA|nr:hypothetical protein Dda_1820 [Drechslerella dactyloides]